VAILVILVLVILWAVVLLPPILRSRSSSTIGGVSNFMDSLRSIGRGHHQPSMRGSALGGPVFHGPVGPGPMRTPMGSSRPGAPMGPRRPAAAGMTPMQRRRRNVLFGLAGATSFFFLVGLVLGSTLVWFVFLLSAASLGGYVYLLLQFKKGSAMFAPVASSVPPPRTYVPPVVATDPEPRVGDNVVVLRRSAG
jgi:hypothetical protein